MMDTISDEEAALQQRIVAADGGAVEGLPHARVGKRHLDHHGSHDDEAEAHGDETDDGKQCVGEHVSEEDEAFWHAFGPGGGDKGVSEHSHQGVARHVSDVANAGEDERGAWQDHVPGHVGQPRGPWRVEECR